MVHVEKGTFRFRLVVCLDGVGSQFGWFRQLFDLGRRDPKRPLFWPLYANLFGLLVWWCWLELEPQLAQNAVESGDGNN